MNQAYIRFPNFISKAVTLSYDDGVRQDKRLVKIMQKHGLKGTFNLSSGFLNEQYLPEATSGHMSVREASELYLPAGMEVAAHGHKHLSLSKVAAAIATNDVITDRKTLESTFGVIVDGMAYANGAYNDQAVDILRNCGIKYARTTVSTESFALPEDWLRLPATCHHNNPRLMALAKQFVEWTERSYWWANAPQLFYLWGHSYEFDNNDNWHVIEEFADYIGGREDVWYATNGEIFDYLQACDRLRFSVDGTQIFNPSVIDVYLDLFGKKVVVPAGKTVKI